MELIKLFNLQGSLFIMILAGAVLKRKVSYGSLCKYHHSLQYC